MTTHNGGDRQAPDREVIASREEAALTTRGEQPTVALSRLFIWALAGAVAGALLAWVLGESTSVWVEPEKVPGVVLGNPMVGSTRESENAAALETAVRSYGAMGAALGLALGLAGGLARGSVRHALQAGLIGLLVVGALGALATLAAVPVYQHWSDLGEDDLKGSMLLHAAIWGTMGATAAVMLGLGAGMSRGKLLQLLVGGAFGAILGAVVFDMLGAVMFAADATGDPVSRSATTRLLARGLVAIGLSLGAIGAIGEARNTSPILNRPSAEGD